LLHRTRAEDRRSVERQTMIKTHGNFVSRSTTKNYSFDSTPFHRLLP
jgi:hypothetical protein